MAKNEKSLLFFGVKDKRTIEKKLGEKFDHQAPEELQYAWWIFSTYFPKKKLSRSFIAFAKCFTHLKMHWAEVFQELNICMGCVDLTLFDFKRWNKTVFGGKCYNKYHQHLGNKFDKFHWYVALKIQWNRHISLCSFL